MNFFRKAPSQEPIAVVIMCEPGVYEWMTLLLVSSLRHFVQDEISIYAYCRRSLSAQLLETTKQFLQSNGVILDYIDPTYRVNYPHGNKVFACAMRRKEKKTVFVDTDTMVVNNFALKDGFVTGSISGRRTGPDMWGKTVEEWDLAYKAANVEMGSQRIEKHVDGGKVMVPPSFNAGVVFFEGEAFAEKWLDVTRQINACQSVPDIFPFLDQIALPIAAKSINLKLNFLSEKWNTGPATYEKDGGGTNIYHYHFVKKIYETSALKIADLVVPKFTQFESFRDMHDFYENSGNKPDTVRGSPGYVRPPKLEKLRQEKG